MSTISDNDPSAHEVTREEAWYDAEIAPALAELGKRCQARGVPFLALVEYQPGDRGRSFFMPEHAGLAMTMVHLCAATAPNIDAYFIALARHCRRSGVDTSASFVMSKLHQPAAPVEGG